MAGNWVNSRGSQSNFLAAIGLIGQTKVGVGREGRARGAAVRRAERQAAPLGRDRAVRLARRGRPRPLAAKVVDGKVGALQLRPALAVHGVRARALVRRTARGCCRLLCVEPGGAAADGAVLAGRRDRAPPLRRDASRWRRARCAPTAGAGSPRWSLLAAFGLWRMIGRLDVQGHQQPERRAFDPRCCFAQIFGVVAFIGGFAADAVEPAGRCGRGQRRWPAKLLEHRARWSRPSSCCGSRSRSSSSASG